MKLTFRQCTLYLPRKVPYHISRSKDGTELFWGTIALLDKTFDLKQVATLPALASWLESQEDLSNFERQALQSYQQNLIKHAHDWNEVELGYGFIGPLITLVDFSEDQFDFFAQRSFEGKVGDIELSGQPDGIIASGLREPEKSYFCFQEYKREIATL